MPKLYNCDRLPVIPRPHSASVEYGETADFSDEEIANGIGGNWSTESPIPKVARVKDDSKKTSNPVKPENDEEE